MRAALTLRRGAWRKVGQWGYAKYYTPFALAHSVLDFIRFAIYWHLKIYLHFTGLNSFFSDCDSEKRRRGVEGKTVGVARPLEWCLFYALVAITRGVVLDWRENVNFAR